MGTLPCPPAARSLPRGSVLCPVTIAEEKGAPSGSCLQWPCLREVGSPGSRSVLGPHPAILFSLDTVGRGRRVHRQSSRKPALGGLLATENGDSTLGTEVRGPRQSLAGCNGPWCEGSGVTRCWRETRSCPQSCEVTTSPVGTRLHFLSLVKISVCMLFHQNQFFRFLLQAFPGSLPGILSSTSLLGGSRFFHVVLSLAGRPVSVCV